LHHERALIAGTLVLLTALGWAFLLKGMPMGTMEPPLTALVAMWWLMMLAMMLPSAAPAILLYAKVRQRNAENAISRTWVFLAGYLAVWLLFSIAAAVAQHFIAGQSMTLNSRVTQAAVLIAAGLYQLSPLKSACVSQCRSPAEFLTRYWQPGWSGAVQLGLRHGVYCVGCCWMLMALLFVGGVMNFLWVIGLTLIVAGEKLLPSGQAIRFLLAAALLIWGGARLLG
jgi:predicted metal-binding membrane protein